MRHVVCRIIAGFTLDHRLMKFMEQQDEDRRLRQIGASTVEMLSRKPDHEWSIGQIEDDIRRAFPA